MQKKGKQNTKLQKLSKYLFKVTQSLHKKIVFEIKHHSMKLYSDIMLSNSKNKKKLKNKRGRN